MILTRVGDVITNKRGEKMAICRFQNNNNIDVIFEGTNHVIKNQTWSAFRNRRIVDAISPQAEAYEQIFDCEGRPWDVITEKDGVYTVRNVATGEIVSDITKQTIAGTEYHFPFAVFAKQPISTRLVLRFSAEPSGCNGRYVPW